MFIFDVLRKDKVYQIIVSDLRRFGVKYRHKKNAVKLDKPERNGNLPQKIFKVHLTCLPLDLVNLSSGAMVHIPIFVIKATAYLLNYIDLEGIFRKAGSKIRQREILSRLDNGGTLAERDHGIDIANCLKTFFREQPEPLIPFYYHDLFVRCVVLKKNRVEALLMACLLLPPIHLNTLAFLMEFLKKVASYEQLNRMSIVNLATVVGPNIMPVKEATMGAIQSRLETHNLVIQLLIENAEKIGILPDNVTEIISADCEIGSTENELERSDNNLTKSKKKKHRSGSFTRMLSGLKKMVGKTSPQDGEPVCEGSNSVFLYTPSLRIGKRRKVEAVNDEINLKKENDLLEVMPERLPLRSRFSLHSPVNNHPNPIKDGTPVHMSRVDKFISSKVPTGMKPINKTEKTKKIRLSFDRFVSRSRQKILEGDNVINKEKPLTRRRSWSITGRPSSESKKKRRSDCSTPRSLSREAKIVKLNSEKDYDEIFMDANINLSDISGEQVSRDKCKSTRNIVTRASTSDIPNKLSKENSILHSTNTSDYVSNNESSIHDSYTTELTNDDDDDNNHEDKEYVKVPKSEYLDIKKRVSAIETQISQEFGSFAKESIHNLRRRNSVDKVQTEYEKTLEQSDIGSTMNADQLAKRLGKELKIRRSSEHKIIRSPSARKIGILRRRSQEKPVSKRVKRTSSWHVSDRTDSICPRRSTLKLNNFYPTNDNQTVNKLEQVKSNNLGVENLGTEAFCSEETNKRLNYLQDQLLTLIDHTNKHTKGSLSDDEFSSNDNTLYNGNGNKLNLGAKVRRISSFHGNEFVDNSQYFNQMVKDLKKGNNPHVVDVTPMKNEHTDKKDKVMSWKDAEKYFKSEGQTTTPVPVTGRASVAKLRTQNAGMVLAKAKLFDDTKRTPIQAEVTNDQRRISHYHQNHNHHQGRETRRQSMRPKEMKTHLHDNIESPRRIALRRKKSVSPKNPSAKVRITKSPNSIKMELTLVQSSHDSTTTTHHRKCTNTKRTLNYQKENHSSPINTPSRNEMKSNHESIVNVDSTIYKTPLIKKPLSVVRTPKSGKPLTRRPAIDVKRTPLKAIGPLATPKRQSPRSILKTSHLSTRRFS